MALTLDTSYIDNFISKEEIDRYTEKAKIAFSQIKDKSGKGSEFLGWTTITDDQKIEELKNIIYLANHIKESTDALIVVGIGGSYIGSRGVIELVKSEFHNEIPDGFPEIYFAGQNMSPSYLNHIINICKNKDVCLNMISKSGTTLESALTFRVLREFMYTKYSKSETRRRIYCTTDSFKGAIRNISDEEGYETFIVPDDIPGRFSVLTAVGLLPMAVAGVNVNEILAGAKQASEDLLEFSKDNVAVKYAVYRNILHMEKKYSTEMLVSYNPSFEPFAKWWQQLFAESEGKEGKGIFPTYSIYSTDLHSMGQFIQDGSPILFETVVDFKTEKTDIVINETHMNYDNLNYLSGLPMSEINKISSKSSVLAHYEAGVPNLIINLQDDSEYEIGYMIYFFELSCAISAYMLGVNPFDQPGVDDYKNNMFTLLKKPGYEDGFDDLLKRYK